MSRSRNHSVKYRVPHFELPVTATSDNRVASELLNNYAQAYFSKMQSQTSTQECFLRLAQ